MSDLRDKMKLLLAEPARCQGICGKSVAPAALADDGGFEVCGACRKSLAWEEELQRRRDAMGTPGPTNVVGRPTVKG